jgi:predicted ATPase/class 3 adenylate cyclase
VATVTFLFTDVEGSTRLLQTLGDQYPELLAAHHRLMRTALQEWRGQEVDTQGDAFFVTFPSAKDAVLAAIEAQRALAAYPWPEGSALRVRMGLHTGEAVAAETGYVGLDVHRAARISAVAHGGQILLSESTAVLVREDLPPDARLRDLGRHRLKDLARAQPLYQVVAPGLPAEFPPLRSLDARAHNLPVQLTTFVGREREIGDVKEFLTSARLVTLTGTGGAGKTRLALQVAAEVLPDFADGVWFAELAPLTDPTLIPQAVASILEVREEDRRSLADALDDFLRAKSLLLILDNCEHLAAACADFTAALLRHCPSLRVLATSREPLGIPGELTYPVPPLSLPDVERPPAPEDLMRFEAVRLFTERAAFSHPGFRVTFANAAAVSQIARRLDGIPLAIELAAARVKALSVEQIAARLDDRFRLLTGTGRGTLPHHQTLKATLDWSYSLLTEGERILLRRLAVFAGGFDLDAAETVCIDQDLPAADVLDLLTRLVDRSLVLFEEHDGAGRYRLLETVRQYALDRLLEAGEHDSWRSRHQDYYDAWSEARRKAIEEAEGGIEIHFAAFALEHDNLRAALQWSWTSHQPTVTLRLAAAMGGFWDRTVYIKEGRSWLEAGITGAGERAPADLRARAYFYAGTLAWHQGDYEQARAHMERSVSLSRPLEAHVWVSMGLSFLGAIAYRQGEYARAAALLDESQTLSRQAGRRSDLAFSLYLRSVVARLQGEYDRAEALGTEALSMSRAINHGRRQRTALDNLGLIARNRGDLGRAEAYCTEALALARRLPDRFGISAFLNSLALIACDRGEWKHARNQVDEGLTVAREMGNRAAVARALNILGRIELHEQHEDRALALHRDALTVFRELGEPLGIAQSLERLSIVAGARRQYETATQLSAAAAQLRERMGSSMPPVDRSEYEEMLGTIRGALGEERFHVIWGESAAAPDQVVATALAGPTPSPGP